MPKILIAEDEVSLARSMADALRRGGPRCPLVNVGEKVLREFRDFVPDLVLLDVRLGGVSGLDLLAEIKRESPEMDAIVVTAYGSVEIAVTAMKNGAADFLSKPIDLDVLAVAVDKVWASSQARRRLKQFRCAQQERLRGVQLLGESPAIVSVRDADRVLRAALRPNPRVAQQGFGKGGPAPEELPPIS